MVHSILLCCALLADGGKPAGPSAADRVAYETARDKAGQNAAAHVQLALWCEAHGMPAERMKHLNLAASLEASSVLARGLLGLVNFQGKWASPDQVAREIKSDPRFQALFRGTEQLGYVYDPRHSEKTAYYSDTVEVPDLNLALPNVQVFVHSACFASGTFVQTLDGPRKIESIKIADRVLSQNTTTGALSFRPVMATHLNGPSKTLRIEINGESIVATGIHRFWKAGKGWTMARDLQPGDRLRMIGGIGSIQSIEPGATQMVYNLDVAENRDFLVGNAGLLVHDFGFVLPVAEPFDRQSNLVPASGK